MGVFRGKCVNQVPLELTQPVCIKIGTKKKVIVSILSRCGWKITHTHTHYIYTHICHLILKPQEVFLGIRLQNIQDYGIRDICETHMMKIVIGIWWQMRNSLSTFWVPLAARPIPVTVGLIRFRNPEVYSCVFSCKTQVYQNIGFFHYGAYNF